MYLSFFIYIQETIKIKAPFFQRTLVKTALQAVLQEQHDLFGIPYSSSTFLREMKDLLEKWPRNSDTTTDGKNLKET